MADILDINKRLDGSSGLEDLLNPLIDPVAGLPGAGIDPEDVLVLKAMTYLRNLYSSKLGICEGLLWDVKEIQLLSSAYKNGMQSVEQGLMIKMGKRGCTKRYENKSIKQKLQNISSEIGIGNDIVMNHLKSARTLSTTLHFGALAVDKHITRYKVKINKLGSHSSYDVPMEPEEEVMLKIEDFYGNLNKTQDNKHAMQVFNYFIARIESMSEYKIVISDAIDVLNKSISYVNVKYCPIVKFSFRDLRRSA